MTQIRIKSLNFFHKKSLGENFFFWNYGVTKLHHIPLVELNFNKKKNRKREQASSVINLYYITWTPDTVVQIK